eukprot:TRINITY_DN1593_c3_g2_i1.p1 TRINITY_DN1593_c3_g2~~TRINITY_DN1593_c3_g2_i1.p1  ORF type:complete len:126 (+),score=3.40 TRINITY_DN1593_c3_g2_i1:201-578(+)
MRIMNVSGGREGGGIPITSQPCVHVGVSFTVFPLFFFLFFLKKQARQAAYCKCYYFQQGFMIQLRCVSVFISMRLVFRASSSSPFPLLVLQILLPYGFHWRTGDYVFYFFFLLLFCDCVYPEIAV